MRGWVRYELLPLLDEQRQVAELAVFHYQVDMCCRFHAVMKGDNVRVSQVLENLDFSIQVLLQLLVQARELNGFDGYDRTGDLQETVSHVHQQTSDEGLLYACQNRPGQSCPFQSPGR